MFVRTLALSQGEGYVRTLLEIEHSSGESRKVMHFWYNTWVRTCHVVSTLVATFVTPSYQPLP